MIKSSSLKAEYLTSQWSLSQSEVLWCGFLYRWYRCIFCPFAELSGWSRHFLLFNSTEAPLNHHALLILAALAEASWCAEHSQTGSVCYQPQSIISSQSRPSILPFSSHFLWPQDLRVCSNMGEAYFPLLHQTTAQENKRSSEERKANTRSKLHVNNFWF